MDEIACDCQACRAMCQGSVCLPTPAEAEDLCKRFPERMSQYVFEDGRRYIAPGPAGLENRTLPRTNMARCTFCKPDGHCELHGDGKPLEGRLAHHTRDWREVRIQVIEHWNQGTV